jgi:DNA-binding SARP family transcriptional activator/predicted ATPase
MARLSIRLLGPFQASLDGQPVSGFASDKVRALLAYLALSPDRPHRREMLAGLLWPEFPERSARTNLRNALASLRHVLGERAQSGDGAASPPFLHSTHQTIRFNGGSDYWLDADAFEGLVTTVPLTTERLEQAVSLVRGLFLEGFSLADAAPFEEWLLLRREYFCRHVVEAHDSLAAIYAGRGAYEQALAHTRRRVEMEPWQEFGQRQLMRLLARNGHRGEALVQYERLCRSLQEELGAEPSQATRALYEDIRSGKLAPEPTLRPGPPVPIWNLPASPTPFFGRAGELVALEEWEADPDTRLLTLTGPGGSGKTRLALEAGTRLAERDRRALAGGSSLAFPHGAVFVPLAAVDTVEGLVPALADALQLRLEGGREQLLESLRRKQILLILDNLEHLLDGVKLLAEILRKAPGVRILATSRERLQLQAERVLPVGGLSYPDHDLRVSSPEAADLDACVAAFPAFQLLVESARRVQPRFVITPADLPVLLDICRQVDGLPLALELAASWADALSLVDTLAEARKSLSFFQAEWRDAPERHRSMQAMFDVSWRRLSHTERSVFSQLSVFRGGFSQEAATQVVGAEVDPRMLAALVRKSFLQYDQPRDRYQIHELLRQYGTLQLAEVPEQEAAAYDRHSRRFCAWLQPLGPDLRSGRQAAALAEIETELENARAACLWAAAQGRADRLNPASQALGWYYYLRGAPGAGDATFRALLERLKTRVDRPLGTGESMDRAMARLCLWQSLFASVLANNGGVTRFAHDALAFLNSPALADQDTRSERAFAWMQLGYAVRETDPEEARLRFSRSLQLYEEIGDPLGISDALHGLGRAARNLRDFEAAERAATECLRLRREAGDGIGAAEATSLLGHIALWQGEFARAEHFLRQGQAGLEWSSFWLSHSLLLAGRFEEARAAAADSIAAYCDLGQRRELAYSMVILGQCHQHRGDYQTAHIKAEDALALARDVDFSRGVGMSLGLLGALALAEGTYEEARTRCEESVAEWQQSAGHPSEFEGELACLGLAARGMGRRDKAWEYILAQLAWAHESQMLMPALFGLAGTALLLVDQGQIEWAVELYALAAQNSFVANSRWFEDVMARRIAAAKAVLAPDLVSAAEARGRARGLEPTLSELVANLPPQILPD